MKGLSLFTKLFLSIAICLLLISGVVAQQSDDSLFGINFEAYKNGVIVSEVLAGSPAAVAGLQPGDVITSVEDEAITFNTFEDVLRDLSRRDESVLLTVLRDGKTIDIEFSPVSWALSPEGITPSWLQRLENSPLFNRFDDLFSRLEAESNNRPQWNFEWRNETEVPRLFQPFVNLLERIFTEKPNNFELKAHRFVSET